MKDDRLYLLHIAECINRIETYTAGGREAFLASTLLQDGVLRNLQTLGESVRRLSETLKAAHPEADWRGVAGFRNVLVHDYLDLDIDIVWEVVATDLPPFRGTIAAILASSDT